MSGATRDRARIAALWMLIPLMLFGVLVGGLMTWHHDTQLYGGASEQGELIGCTESAEVNCDVVNTSDHSELLGVPIATLAIPFYLTILGLAIAGLRSREGATGLIVVAGAGAVLYSGFLYHISKTELGVVCAWCIRLYAVNGGILALGLAASGRPRWPDARLLLTTGLYYGAALAISVVAERTYRASLTGAAGEAPTATLAERGAERRRDPVGPAPDLSFAVKTEDGRDATLKISPDDPWVGANSAQVAVVMFGDLECGYCKRSSAELARLEATYGDRVLFVYKHFPMDPGCNPGVKNKKHARACAAARASVCAQQEGLFWAFHDLAYKNQHQLGDDYLRTYHIEAGGDGAKFDLCMASPDSMMAVRDDAEAGAALDVHGTPRIFINGALYRSGSSAEVMARAIEVALGATAQEASQRAAGLRTSQVASGAVPVDTPPSRTIVAGDLKFNIDTFEASVHGGVAESARREIPALHVSWFEAKAACERAGRRMCREEEWVSACQGARAIDDNHNGEFADDMIEGTAYPYGDLHEPNRCWDGRVGDNFRPVYTGELPGCVTAAGVYDLTGNVEEWVGETPETAALLGGAWDTSDDHARCYRRNDTFGAGYSSPRTGFRCCSG